MEGLTDEVPSWLSNLNEVESWTWQSGLGEIQAFYDPSPKPSPQELLTQDHAVERVGAAEEAASSPWAAPLEEEDDDLNAKKPPSESPTAEYDEPADLPVADPLQEDDDLFEDEIAGLLEDIEQFSDPPHHQAALHTEDGIAEHARGLSSSPDILQEQFAPPALRPSLEARTATTSQQDGMGGGALRFPGSPVIPSSSTKSSMQQEMRYEEAQQDEDELTFPPPPPLKFLAQAPRQLSDQASPVARFEFENTFSGHPRQQVTGHTHPFDAPSYPLLSSSNYAIAVENPPQEGDRDLNSSSTNQAFETLPDLPTPEDGEDLQSPIFSKITKRVHQSRPALEDLLQRAQKLTRKEQPATKKPKLDTRKDSQSDESDYQSSKADSVLDDDDDDDDDYRQPGKTPKESPQKTPQKTPKTKSGTKTFQSSPPSSRPRPTNFPKDLDDIIDPRFPVQGHATATAAPSAHPPKPKPKPRPAPAKRASTNTVNSNEKLSPAGVRKASRRNTIASRELSSLVGDSVMKGVTKKRKISPRKTRGQKEAEVNAAPNAGRAAKRRHTEGTGK